jgi:hypothetical protein
MEDGETIRASWVVGADGAHSTVREQVGVSFEGAPYPQTFVLVDGEYDTDCLHDESYYMLSPSGVVVVVGLPGGLYRVFASIAPGQEVGDVEETVARIAAERSPVRLKQVKAHGSGAFQIQARMAGQLRAGRVLLIGDAAHVHSPAGGLGLNTGVEDAHSLAWRLAGILRGASPVSELDGWEKERTLVARGIIAETDRQTKMWMLTGWKRVRRDLGIQFRTRTGIAKRVLPRRMAMLDAVLPVAGPGLKDIQPGGRLHNVPIGGDRQLRDLLRTGGHLLLVFSDQPAPVLEALGVPDLHDPSELRTAVVSSAAAAGALDLKDVEAVTDPGNRVRRAVRAPADSVVLVRPDGLIAAAIDTADTAALGALRARLGGLRILEGEKK